MNNNNPSTLNLGVVVLPGSSLSILSGGKDHVSSPEGATSSVVVNDNLLQGTFLAEDSLPDSKKKINK